MPEPTVNPTQMSVFLLIRAPSSIGDDHHFIDGAPPTKIGRCFVSSPVIETDTIVARVADRNAAGDARRAGAVVAWTSTISSSARRVARTSTSDSWSPSAGAPTSE